MTISVASLIQDTRNLLQFTSANNLPDSTILYYMNQEWQITIPQSFVNNDFKSTATFMTTKGVASYQINTTVQQNIVGQIFCDGVIMYYLDDPSKFQLSLGTNRPNVIFLYGNGTTGAYEGVFPSFPLVPGFTDALGNLMSNFFVTTAVYNGTYQSVYDDGNGNLIGDGTGKIDYETGAVTQLLFNSAVPSGTPIYGDGFLFTQGRPAWVLYNQNIFSFRPVPNQPYCIQYSYYAAPLALTQTGTLPINRYRELLPRGTALKIVQTLKDPAQTAFLKQLYDESANGIRNMTTIFQENDRRSTQFYKPNAALSVNNFAMNNPAPYT